MISRYCSIAAASCEMVAIDFETTGSMPGHLNVPWQIGLVPVVDGRLCPERAFTSLLKVPSEQPFNPMTPGRWAQLRNELALSPSLPELWDELRPLLTGRPLIAHNAATERSILRQQLPLQEFGPWIDTLTISRRAYPSLSDFKLENLAVSLELEKELGELCPGLAPHNALYDAFACGLLLSRLLHAPGWDKASVANLASMK